MVISYNDIYLEILRYMFVQKLYIWGKNNNKNIFDSFIN